MTVCGSRAYNMSTSSSDVDIKGILICPKEYYFGFLNRFEQADKSSHMMKFYEYLTDEEKDKADQGELEGSIYELSKFMKLAAGCNPNILDVLFCRDQEVRYITSLGKKLRDNRDLFLSKKARYTYEGYATSQLKRIKSHRQFLLNPPGSPPERKDFGLPDRKLIPGEQLQAAENAINKKLDSWEIDFGTMDKAGKIHVQEQLEQYMLDLKLGTEDKFKIAAKAVGSSDNFIELMIKERDYRIAKYKWRQYQEWKKNRNPERAELERRFFYDCKFAMHLARLLKTCKELLKTGELKVYRDDADELLAIKNGALTYDQLMEFVEKESKEIKVLYEVSTLRYSPDMNRLDNLCVEIIEEFHEG